MDMAGRSPKVLPLPSPSPRRIYSSPTSPPPRTQSPPPTSSPSSRPHRHLGGQGLGFSEVGSGGILFLSQKPQIAAFWVLGRVLVEGFVNQRFLEIGFFVLVSIFLSASSWEKDWIFLVVLCTMASLAVVESGERQRQRYDRNYRLVAGCIPYRLKQDVKDFGNNLTNIVEVLMISSPNRNDLVFPKGGWELEESQVEAACREALEEAGVRGDIKGTLGVWVFRSKSSEKSGTNEGSCRGTMYALEVTEELTSWAEQSTHQRRWLNVHEAWKFCRYDWMREALVQFLELLSREFPSQISKLSLTVPCDGSNLLRGKTLRLVSTPCTNGDTSLC